MCRAMLVIPRQIWLQMCIPILLMKTEKRTLRLFEDAFYKKNNLDPNMVSEEVDMELLMKALANPEMRALLNSLAKTMK